MAIGAAATLLLFLAIAIGGLAVWWIASGGRVSKHAGVVILGLAGLAILWVGLHPDALPRGTSSSSTTASQSPITMSLDADVRAPQWYRVAFFSFWACVAMVSSMLWRRRTQLREVMILVAIVGLMSWSATQPHVIEARLQISHTSSTGGPLPALETGVPGRVTLTVGGLLGADWWSQQMSDEAAPPLAFTRDQMVTSLDTPDVRALLAGELPLPGPEDGEIVLAQMQWDQQGSNPTSSIELEILEAAMRQIYDGLLEAGGSQDGPQPEAAGEKQPR